MPTVRDLLAAINSKYPLSRAESWDRVGLQIGDANAEIRSAMVAHEITDEVLDAAGGQDALVVYHPLLFRPLENLDFKNHTARLAGRCLKAGHNVVAVHGALDNAPQPHALGDRLAASLGLGNVQVLQATGYEPLFKIVVFTPTEALDQVCEALWDAGAGTIGNYDRTSFRSRGTGTFCPLPGAEPHTGEVGKLEMVEEFRLEVIVTAANRDAVVKAMLAAHPYEEVAHDIYPLYNKNGPYGAARTGELSTPLPFADWAAQVRSALQAPSMRAVLGSSDTIRKVACSPGSGASFIDAAVRAGCDCLVTGDIKHHDALKASAMGLAVLDTTHTATERATIVMLSEALAPLGIPVTSCTIDTNPFQHI